MDPPSRARSSRPSRIMELPSRQPDVRFCGIAAAAPRERLWTRIILRIPLAPSPASLAPGSPPSRPLRAAFGGGLRPALTAPAPGAPQSHGRDEVVVSQSNKEVVHEIIALDPNLPHVSPAMTNRKRPHPDKRR